MNNIMNQQAWKLFNEGSKTFSLASFFLTEEVMLGSSYIYYWLHYCDEAIRKKLYNETIKSLRNKIFIMTFQSPLPPPFEVLKLVMKKHSIPLHYPLEFLEGLKMDQNKTKFKDLFELDLYCYRITATKGLMLSHVMGLTDERALESIKDLGIAIELINISKKLETHVEKARCYIPQSINHLAVSDVTKELVLRANSYLTSGLESISSLPIRSGLLIYITATLHQDLGKRILKRKKMSASPLQKWILISKSFISYIFNYLPARINRSKTVTVTKTMKFNEK